ncbi:hypothetical protein [Polyangium sp. 6x1]|uniref:hypothetical protein n=1 Tax=Polyangium sp. 6x1 TaxID=3042689 RepID=UPI002482E903|nr:hypothetical protein [Polyangium sp. 6x1]MDI1442800.1 hypothetical protein [Polyangium sp. 6x1]
MQRDENETRIDSGPLVPAPAMYAAPVDTTPLPAGSSSASPSTTDTNASGPPSAPPQGGCAGCRVGESGDAPGPVEAGFVVAMGFVALRLFRRRTGR